MNLIIPKHLRKCRNIITTEQELIDFLWDNRDSLNEISLRMVTKIADLMRDAHHLDSAEKLANILISSPNEVEILMKRWVGNKQDLIAAQ